MDPIYEYLLAYYWHGVSDRGFKDLCREIVELEPEEASPDERQRMVDEACRAAVMASDEAERFEEIAGRLRAESGKHGPGDDLLDSLGFALNAVIEDRERADSFTKEVANLNLGGQPRMPRRPRVANPFLPFIRAGGDDADGGAAGETADAVGEGGGDVPGSGGDPWEGPDGATSPAEGQGDGDDDPAKHLAEESEMILDGAGEMPVDAGGSGEGAGERPRPADPLAEESGDISRGGGEDPGTVSNPEIATMPSDGSGQVLRLLRKRSSGHSRADAADEGMGPDD